MNELLLILTLVINFGAVLLAYYIFGKSGLYAVTVLATVLANVEVAILIHAFGMEQTLGNVLFAATFLITDILSECEGKRYANKAVWLGIFSQLLFLAISQCWLLFIPKDGGDTVWQAVCTLFALTPRLVLASLATYAVSQIFDVWLYHEWWKLTEKKTGDKRRFLWLRNNGSTLISQLINAALFTFLAFVGTYDFLTMLEIFGSSYVIFIVTSLLDTPILYLARKFRDNQPSNRRLRPPLAEERSDDRHGA